MTSSPVAFLRSRSTAVTGAAIAALTLLAWRNRFIQDDAFISFRYAERFARGEGLTWNPGEYVEGYTNFLWTVIHAVPFRLGIDPVGFSYALGLALFVGSLWCTYAYASRLIGGVEGAIAAVVLLGTNFTFSSYATSGMETQLQSFLFLAAGTTAYAAWRAGWPPRLLGGISLAAAAAVLTRLDSSIYVTVLFGFVGIGILRGDRRPVRVAWLLGPFALVIGAWLIWKSFYYGAILPNTFHAKVVPFDASWRRGLDYAGAFATSYWLWVPAAFAVVSLPRLIRRADPGIAFTTVAVLAWVAYVIRVGGDFMEFRFFVPVLPFFFVLLAWTLVNGTERRWLQLLVVFLVVTASAVHAIGFRAVHRIEPIPMLESHLFSADDQWVNVGKTLGETFGGRSSEVAIATIASGAVAFYSDLRVVDMLGLTDAWVSRHGTPLDPRRSSPGHARLAPPGYLVRRDVNLVVGRPLVQPTPPTGGPVPVFDLRQFHIYEPPPEDRPSSLRLSVIGIPLDGERSVFVLYLVGHPEVDRAIRERGLRTYPVSWTRTSPG